MEVTLMKIKNLYFDEVIDNVIKNYEQTGSIFIDKEYLDSMSEKITINGTELICDINIDNYVNIVNTSDYSYIKLANVGIQLHNDLICKDGNKIPKNILYQKEVWAYLSLSIFKTIVEKLRKLDGDNYEDKIKKIYFNCGQISRTCLFFTWCMIDRLSAGSEKKLIMTAFEFIDPVKAIFERTLSRSPLILKAFVQGIINNNKDTKFKQDPYRRTVPNNLSCYAAVNVLETLEYDELVKTITEQQRLLIN